MQVSGQLHALAALHLEETLGTHWIGGWMDPSVGLDTVAKRKIHSLPLPKFEPQSSSL
jgi:hypothetical protein